MGRFYLVIRKPADKQHRVISASNLNELIRKKHNYKTSPYFKDAYISPIYDNRKLKSITDFPIGVMGVFE